VKGAAEGIFPLCVSGTAGALEANTALAAAGLRVLAVAVGHGADEKDLELLGLIGIADPPRAEATAAVRAARDAGIKVVMITGDHPATAMAIAREMGVVRAGEDPAPLVHARATPEEKLELVRAWKARGEVVAMTGDGVNDAPALKEAHIGVAMGIAGSEVAREASDMILTDDNFASIVAAVREGRAIFENIQKTLVYLLSGNASELFLMFGAALVGLPAPLTPLMILWINLVTDGLPALALVTDPASADALKAPPRAPSAPILGRAQWLQIILTGVIETVVVGAVFLWSLERTSVQEARSLAFATLVLAEVLRALGARSTERVLFEVGVFTNPHLLLVIALTITLQAAIHFLPWTEQFFGVAPLGVDDVVIALSAALIPTTLIELSRLVRRRFRSR
jgi:P-type Ca2+ transporter type 2C